MWAKLAHIYSSTYAALRYVSTLHFYSFILEHCFTASAAKTASEHFCSGHCEAAGEVLQLNVIINLRYCHSEHLAFSRPTSEISH